MEATGKLFSARGRVGCLWGTIPRVPHSYILKGAGASAGSPKTQAHRGAGREVRRATGTSFSKDGGAGSHDTLHGDPMLLRHPWSTPSTPPQRPHLNMVKFLTMGSDIQTSPSPINQCSLGRPHPTHIPPPPLPEGLRETSHLLPTTHRCAAVHPGWMSQAQATKTPHTHSYTDPESET